MRRLLSLTLLACLVVGFGRNASAKAYQEGVPLLGFAELLEGMRSLESSGLAGPRLSEPALAGCSDEEMVDCYLEANRTYFQQIRDVVRVMETWLGTDSA